jgi:hypothetical protein
MDHRDCGYTKKKEEKAHIAVRACMHEKQQERRAQSERASERSSEQAHFV